MLSCDCDDALRHRTVLGSFIPNCTIKNAHPIHTISEWAIVMMNIRIRFVKI